MHRYSKLRDRILNDKDVVDKDGMRDRKLFSERFSLPLLNEITFDYMPEDADAIETNDSHGEVWFFDFGARTAFT